MNSRFRDLALFHSQEKVMGKAKFQVPRKVREFYFESGKIDILNNVRKMDYGNCNITDLISLKAGRNIFGHL